MEPVHPLLAGPQLLVTWPYLVLRALDDLHKVVEIAEDNNQRMRAIEAHAAAIQGQVDTAVEVGRSLVAEGRRIEKAAKQVTDRAGDVVAAIPVLEQALALTQPLEGAVSRLGRFLDNLPGGGPGALRP